MPELVAGDVAERRGFGGPVKLVADGVLGQPPPVMGEQETGRAAIPGVEQRAARGADRGDLVDHVECLGVEGTIRSLSSLPSVTSSHAPEPVDRVHAVELKVEQLADPQPAGPLQEQLGGGQSGSATRSAPASRRSASTGR